METSADLPSATLMLPAVKAPPLALAASEKLASMPPATVTLPI